MCEIAAQIAILSQCVLSGQQHAWVSRSACSRLGVTLVTLILLAYLTVCTAKVLVCDNGWTVLLLS